VNSPGPSRGRERWIAFAALLIPLALAAVYWPGFSGGFAFDDFPNIVDNVRLHVTEPGWDAWFAAAFSSPSSELQRPLAMLSFAINHYFTGLDPGPMKATNLAIHALNALLVLALVRCLLRAVTGDRAERTDGVAAFAAAAWALHPINLMPVLFVVQRMESLSHTFVFAGLWLYLSARLRQQAGGRGWAGVLAGLVLGTGLGLLAKESSVLLPVYALALELFLLGFRTTGAGADRRLFAMFGVVLVLPAIAGSAWLLSRALRPGAWNAFDFSLGERLLTEPRVVLDYLRWTLLPDLGELSLYHDDYPPSRGLWSPPSTAFALAGVLALAALSVAMRRRRPLLGLGLAWFLSAHLLTATFVPLELVFEHRNYFASLGVCLALADVLLRIPQAPGRRRVATLAAVAMLVLFAGATHLRAREWSHPVRFTMSEVAKHPGSPRATYDLARTLIVLGNYDPASPFTQEAGPALERARAVPNAGVMPVHAQLMLAARTGRPLERAWWEELQAHLRKGPNNAQGNLALADLSVCAIEGLCNFPREDMLATFDAASARGPRAEVLNIRAGYVLGVLKQPDEALRLWREAIALNPREPQLRINLAKLLIATDRLDEARAEIARLRAMGRLGQNEAAARELEARLSAREQGPNRPPGAQPPP
jgi:tetratricopeptide (TPR) repeat protein